MHRHLMISPVLAYCIQTLLPKAPAPYLQDAYARLRYKYMQIQKAKHHPSILTLSPNLTLAFPFPFPPLTSSSLLSTIARISSTEKG